MLSPLLDCPHCEVDGSVGGQYDHGDFRIERFQARQEVKRCPIGQNVIRNHNISLQFLANAYRILTGAGLIHLVSVPFQVLTNEKPQVGFIVNHKYSVLTYHAVNGSLTITSAPPSA